ncbi:hypothetical protein PRUPE_1G266700 [Prunus persica]|uniref:Uncharacterized protein n=1 Tax=Prunus persica TaxID=3760 RepID=A0A251R3U3_PRUPE|nr:hypothetical protein PRUPE_1G266700 [Prunus persica]
MHICVYAWKLTYTLPQCSAKHKHSPECYYIAEQLSPQRVPRQQKIFAHEMGSPLSLSQVQNTVEIETAQTTSRPRRLELHRDRDGSSSTLSTLHHHSQGEIRKILSPYMCSARPYYLQYISPCLKRENYIFIYVLGSALFYLHICVRLGLIISICVLGSAPSPPCTTLL